MSMRYLVVTLLVLFVHCGDPIAFIWDVSVTTDKPVYNADEQLYLTIGNPSETEVEVTMCNTSVPVYTLLKMRDNIWDIIYSPDCGNTTLTRLLRPGEEIQLILDLADLGGEIEELQGFFRFRVQISSTANNGHILLPDQVLLSNVFRIV
jgi:hypothetical protein